MRTGQIGNYLEKVQHDHNDMVLYVCWQGENCCRSYRCEKKVKGQVVAVVC